MENVLTNNDIKLIEELDINNIVLVSQAEEFFLSLIPRQQKREAIRYCLIDGMSPKECAIRAGYSPTTITHPGIIFQGVGVERAIAGIRAIQAKKNSLTKETVLSMLRRVCDEVLTAGSLPNYPTVVSSLREISKLLDFYPAQKLDVKAEMDAQLTLDGFNEGIAFLIDKLVVLESSGHDMPPLLEKINAQLPG